MKFGVALLILLLAGGGWLIGGAGPEREHVVSAGVPLDVVRPAGPGPHPGVVVAHGFAGSARLMAPFGDTLAARGYVVVLLDFSGHGANIAPLPDQAAGTDESTRALEEDLGAAVAYLRDMPGVDPARIGMVGHSMGAGAVSRYAAAHPGITATVAISLPGASAASANGPARLLTVVGALEFAGFRSTATEVAAQRADRAVRVVPGVEHITVLYAPQTHRATVQWLDSAFGVAGDDDAIPFPGRRLAGAALLVLALVLGLYPLAARLSGASPRPWPRSRWPWREIVVATPIAVVAAVAARFLPTAGLPLAIGGYVAGYAAITGALLVLVSRRKPPAGGRRRFVLTVPYAIVAIAVPIHLGLTHALPAGARWWLLPVVWAAFALLAYGAERATEGDPFRLLTIAAIFTVVLAVAAGAGLTHGFVILVLFPLAGLLLWQALWSAILHRFAAPVWSIALTGATVVAWPLAVTLPLV